ncbi:glycosyltransferase family 1 protein [Mucilaginibacter gossypii]|uniref:glycosyltransferase family 4 protein n=1 Tax=Mucilaginibacter gossypii TaxID=551996 RepID=UPI000DCEE972|nr:MULTISPECIES: glycosyltransferase family 1 protein [Mucilaginibacter]QTE40227.1 glycosyltransferase family 1 protein [Mucilaginibacter gossypii]RAV47120.1 glycosyltransferase family 1 protein [Mucilaginibacter rubeus]
MKIGYDAKRAFYNNTGLGNYSRWLIKGIASLNLSNLLYLYTPKAKANPRLNFIGDYPSIRTVTPKSKWFTSWWRSKGIIKDLKRYGIELYHGLSHELPSGIEHTGIKSVVTMHDLIFMRYPKHFGAVNYRIYLAKVKHACRVSDQIIAISQKTKDDLVDLLSIAPQKIEVVYQGCDPSFAIEQTAAQKSAVKEKYKLPNRFILSVGTIEERKNLLLTVKALKNVDDITLVVIGKETRYTELVKACITANNLNHRVIFLKDVTFAELPAVYQLASVFVYPSRYEGFGIPVLEALNSGTPVIAATGSCLEEAGGPGSLYVNSDDDIGLAEKLNQVLSDDDLRQTMITKGRAYAANFTNDKLSLQLMQLYQNILNHA